MRRKKLFKPTISLLIVMALLLSTASGVFPTESMANSEGLFCNISFSKPAICCNEGETISLSDCNVQFSADSVMTTTGISWTYDGAIVTSFTPSERGIYALTARAGSNTKTIYVVAKSSVETEYVLYRNDFDTAPTDFRVVESSNGATISVSGSNYILNASGNVDAYARILLPEFLDSFGDVTMRASVKFASATDDSKWTSLMYRVQEGDYPYYHCLLRRNATAVSGTEIASRNLSNKWEVHKSTAFQGAYSSDYNLLSVTARGTHTVFSVNGFQVLDYANTAYAAGALGIQTRGANVMVDYVEVTLDGNDPLYASCDVSNTKPAIRADIGQTIDLTACDVQLKGDAVYTRGSDITWKKDGETITTFTPTAAGVTHLVAVYGSINRNVYVVTRNLSEGEYVLYRNDFDTAPSDFRVIQQTNASFSHDGAGNYIIDASASANSYGRVLLPAWLDEFGDFSFEARYKDTNATDTKKWSALMGHVRNTDYPYMQFCIRNDASQENGVEITHKSDPVQTVWDVRKKGSATKKVTDAYNTYTLIMQDNLITGSLNGTEVITCRERYYAKGAMGLQVRGLKMTVDYVKVTLGPTTAEQDTAVKCYVSKSRPAIGCNAGQTILLDQCSVQFTYGSYAVDGSQITWKKDGVEITEFSDTSVGMHTLTATHGHTTMNVYVVAKETTAAEYILYSNDFTTGPTDYRVPEASNGGTVYPIDGTFVLNGSASADSYVRVLMPAYLDVFGDAEFEASIMLSNPVDTSKWGAIMYRTQNATNPYLQCCYRYDATASNGVEITERTAEGTWDVLYSGSTTSHTANVYNKISVSSLNIGTTFSINGTKVLSATDTPYYNGSWGFHVRGLTMTIDYVKLSFSSNYTATSMYTIPGGYVDVREPSTGISVAPSLITDVKTKADFDNILSGCPAIAIMNYDVVDGMAKIVFSDGAVMPDEALDKLGSKVIPAFRINDNADADSLASFLKGRSMRDAYAVSNNLSVLNRAYTNWKYIRGVADYSSYTGTDAEAIRYNAMANSARVLILPESTSRDMITQLQDSYACVWLTISEGKTASVAATNKGPYGLITPNRSITEYCYKNYYGANTLVRRTNVIGHRGNPSQAPENTILGTQTAYNYGANMVENDIYLAADDVVVVMHDETIDRTTNGSGSVMSMTSVQLKQYQVDYFSGVTAQAIPTLEDYFKTIKGKTHQKLVIEMKHPTDRTLAQALCSLIEKYDILDQVVIISFVQNNLIYMKEILPGVPVGWLNWLEFEDRDPVYAAYKALENIQSYNCVCNPGYSGWSAPVIKELVNRGVTLWPWTVNNQTQFDQLMIDGVGGITTDYNQWCKDYIESIHWNSASRVISSTYQQVLTDITNSCEVVIVEDTLGITCSAGNITVPEKKEGGKASFYYRYKSTTPTGISYYTVTEIRTIEVAPAYSFELIGGSSLALSSSRLTNVTDQHKVADVKAEFKHPVAVLDKEGNALSDTAWVTTGCTVYLEADSSQRAVIVIRGDVNGDGVVNSTDYLRIKSHFLKTAELSDAYYAAADCDGDGSVSAVDYIRVKAYFLGTFDLFG